MLIAAYGWEHEAWSGSFYPDDLPPDWRLGYYANEFDAVVVPFVAWQGQTVATLRSWCDEVSAGFRFVLEQKGPGSAESRAGEAVSALGQHFAGVVADEGAGTESVGPLGRWGPSGEVSPGPLAVLTCPEGALEPRRLRGYIEALAAAGGPALLCCGAGAGAPDALRTARTIADLLGIDAA